MTVAMDSKKAERTLEWVLRLLCDRDYDSLVRLPANSALTADHLRTSLDEFPIRHVFPAVPLESLMDVVEVAGTCPRRWSVRFDLWTASGRRSDLSLEMCFLDVPGDLYGIEIDGLHVL